MLTPDDRKEIEQILRDKADVLSAFKNLDVAQLEQLGQDIEQYLYARQATLRKPKNTYTPRWTLAGSDINADNSSVGQGHAGPTLPRWIDLVSGTAYLDSSDPQMLHIAGSGGADCEFDYLVSSCWTGTAGQSFTTASGCTFKMYATVQAAWNDSAALTGTYFFLLCHGEAGPLNIASDGADTSATIYMRGTGRGTTITGGTNNAGLIISGGVKKVFFEKVNFIAGSGATNAVQRTAGSQDIEMRLCHATGTVYLRDRVFQAETCFFGVVDMAANGYKSWLRNCYFTNTVYTGTETYIMDCVSDFGSGIGIDGVTNGTGAILVEGHVFRSTGTAYTYFIKAGNGALSVKGCRATVSATAAILVDSTYALTGRSAEVVGNDWGGGGLSLGIDIQGSVVALCYTGNSHGSNAGVMAQTSGAGDTARCVFGPNSPANGTYSVTSSTSSNIYFPGSASSGGGVGSASDAEAYVTIGASSTLSAERALTAGNGSGFTDGGANSTVTLNLVPLTALYDQSGAFNWVNRGGDLLIANSKSLKIYSDNSTTPSSLTGQWLGSTGHLSLGSAAASPPAGQTLTISDSVGSGNLRGLNLSLTSTTASSNAAQRVTGLLFGVTLNAGSGTQANAHGIYGSITQSGAAAVTNLDSLFLTSVISSAAAGAITTFSGIRVGVAGWSGPIPTTTYLLNGSDQGNASVTTAYGLYVPAQTGVASRSYIGDPLVVGGADRAKTAVLDVAGDIRLDGVAASGTPAADDLVEYNETGTGFLKVKDPSANVYNLTHLHLIPAQLDVTVASTSVPYQMIGPMPQAGVIVGVEAKTGENKTNGATSAIFDIHKILAASVNTDGTGTTFFTTQGNRPTISNGNMLSTTTLPDVTAFAAGDYIACYTDQSGTSLTVANLGIKVRYT